jgi:RNA polymerase sigma factor (sigma-70 family)
MEEMYANFSRGVRFLLCRKLGSKDLDDKVHDVFVVVAQAICNGELREPERLMGFVHTVVRRKVAGCIDQAVKVRRSYVDVHADSISDRRPDPERDTSDRQRMALAMSVLKSLPKRERQVLTRFYLDEDKPEEICRDMDLSETQFRLIKSRAKDRFAELGKKGLARHTKAFPIAS